MIRFNNIFPVRSVSVCISSIKDAAPLLHSFPVSHHLLAVDKELQLLEDPGNTWTRTKFNLRKYKKCLLEFEKLLRGIERDLQVN